MPQTIQVKSVLNKHKKRDSWFLDDYSANFYSGCSYNCLYCYIRGSKYGENLADKLSVKINALDVFERQLKRRAEKGEYGFIVLSSVTDPYLDIEEEYQMTRSALKIILKYKFPVHVITKSTLVERDFDLLLAIDKVAVLPNDLKPLKRGCILSFSYSTLDNDVARIFEPGAPTPTERLKIQAKAIEYGLFTGVSLMPMLPFISDTKVNLEHMFLSFQTINVNYILPATIGLYGTGKYDSKQMVLKAVKKHYPELYQRYLGYFSNSNELPIFYQQAFKQKMQELSTMYAVPISILPE